MPSVCTVSTTGHAAACPDGLRATEHRELADEVDLLLGEQAPASSPRLRPRAEPRLQPVLGLVRGGDDAHALAVVATARGLDHDRPADLVAEGLQRRPRPSPAPTAGRRRRSGEPARIASLSWAKTQRRGAGVQRDPVGLQGRQHVGRDVLVVERDDVAVAGERPHGLEVGVVPTGAEGTTSAAPRRRLGEHATA